MIALLKKDYFSPRVKIVLSYIPSAVFPAIIFPAIFLNSTGQLVFLDNPKGVAVMEAPVSFLAKAPIGASRNSAQLQIFVGGTTEHFEQHLPLFRALGGMPEQSYHAGPNGSGYGIKVLLNLLWFIYAAGTSEVLAIGSR